jgi:HSP20 family protein
MPLPDKWTPLRELDLMDRRMRRFFEELGFVPPTAPAADVYETGSELIVELEVPGFDAKELEVEVFDHTLSIAGERTELVEKKETTLRLHDRLETKFERRFALPAEIDGEHIKAEYLKGVLTVHVPKVAQVTPRKVEIAKA